MFCAVIRRCMKRFTDTKIRKIRCHIWLFCLEKQNIFRWWTYVLKEWVKKWSGEKERKAETTLGAGGFGEGVWREQQNIINTIRHGCGSAWREDGEGAPHQKHPSAFSPILSPCLLSLPHPILSLSLSHTHTHTNSDWGWYNVIDPWLVSQLSTRGFKLI